MERFNRERYRQEEFDGLKNLFMGIARNDWSSEEISKRIKQGEFDDPINYRKADTGSNAGQTLTDDFQRAMDELELSMEERKKIADYYLTFKLIPTPYRSGWEETQLLLKGILEAAD